MGFVAVVVYLQVNMLDFYSGNMCVESLWSLSFTTNCGLQRALAHLNNTLMQWHLNSYYNTY